MYTYKALSGPRNFRLLRILPGADTNVVSVEMHEVSLDDKPIFDALSYTWNLDPTYSFSKGASVEVEKWEKRPILCNGLTLHITMNLYHALIQFRRMKLELPIWADQVCINQQDDNEKPAQLVIMTEIYETASTVLIWLGTLSRPRNWALDFIEDLPEHPITPNARKTPSRSDDGNTPMFGSIKGSFNAAKSLSGSAINVIRWLTVLMGIIAREWFKRIWTLQEFLLCNRFKFLMGSREILQSVMVKASAQAVHFLESDALGFGSYTVFLKSIIAEQVRLFDYREAYRSGKRWTAEEYILLTNSRRASVAKDHVFGGAAVLKGGLPKSVDYSSTTRDIYLAFATERLWPQSGVASLAWVGGHLWNVKGLPSWVPDLNRPVSPKPLQYCRLGTPHPASDTTRYDYRIEGATVHLRGVNVGAVSQIGESIWTWTMDIGNEESYPARGMVTSTEPEDELWGSMFALLNDVGHKYEPTGEPTLDAFWKTLTAGIASTSQDSSAVWRTRFQHYLAFRYLIRKSHLNYKRKKKSSLAEQPWLIPQIEDLSRMEERFAKFLKGHDTAGISTDGEGHAELPSLTIKETILARSNRLYGADSEEQTSGLASELSLLGSLGKDDEFHHLVIAFRDLFLTVYDGRRIFLTDGGFLGISLEGVRPGDLVYLVAGADTPYVLRPVENEEATFTLVGEAYVHGLEIEGKIPIDDIRIV